MSRKAHKADNPDSEERPRMSDELVVLVRHSVATGYYDQPHVIDTVARRCLSEVRSASDRRDPYSMS